MSGRLKDAENDLSRGALRADPSAALWRGMVAAGKGEWDRAIEFFRAAERQLYLYPSVRGAEFSAVWAEAALRANDFDAARRQANLAVANGEREVKERGQLVLANLRATIDGPAAAWPELDRLSKSAVEPVAVRAELRRLELAVPAGKMSANEAAQELEALRFRRGNCAGAQPRDFHTPAAAGGRTAFAPQHARGGMGSHKHGTSGRGGPSPKTKFMAAFDANRLAEQERQKRPQPASFSSIAELMRQRRPTPTQRTR
jgi:hypothetical protein